MDANGLWFERPYYLGSWQVNLYYWFWHDFLCRLEPFTFEWRRHVAKWWLVDIIVGALILGAMLYLLLWPPCAFPFWLKVTILTVGVLGSIFFAWLLLHLGGFAEVAVKKIFRR